MPSWTTDARVQRLLSSEEQTLLTAAGVSLSTLISDASSIAETDLEALYWPFPDAVAPTPGEGEPQVTIITPLYIQDMVALKAASMARITLGVLSELHPDTDQAGPTYASMYENKIEMLRAGTAQIPVVHVVGEALAFGVSPLDLDQHKYNPEGLNLNFELIPESVRVTSYQLNDDFSSTLSTKDRGWLFVTKNSAIVDDVTVSYDFTYLKAREKARRISYDSAELIPS